MAVDFSSRFAPPVSRTRVRAGKFANLAGVFVFAAPLVVAGVMGYRQRWVAEDAFITLRAVDHLLNGYGPVFNVGERVEVYTHPLWLLLLAGFGLIGFQPATAAVYAGLSLSIAGIALAQLGAARLASARFGAGNGGRVNVPIGMAVFVAIPVVWDFLTSGLETGLTFAWLGFSFWLTVRYGTRPGNLRPGVPWSHAAVLGAGILVRPDLGLFAVAFLVALAVCDGAERAPVSVLSRTGWLVLSFGMLPAIYQVFRMGYFAVLVPNTALAKEASGASWDQGWEYLVDLVGIYHLWLPLALVLAFWAWLVWMFRAERDLVAVAAAPVAGALLHGLYVVRVGGDFMHGRLLLPALFGVLLPVAAMPLPALRDQKLEWILLRVGLVWVVAWAVWCGLFLRWSPEGAVGRDGIPVGIVDERRFFVEQTGNRHPMSVADYRGTAFEWVEHGWRMRDLAATYPRIVLTDYDEHPLREDVDPAVGLVIYARSIGVQSHAAGDQIRLVDLHGLGDPLAGRIKIAGGERPGHAKEMPQVWIHARYADLDAVGPLPADLQAASDVLACREVSELLAAVEEPMTVSRFLRNIILSPELTRLRIDSDPFVARRELCPDG